MLNIRSHLVTGSSSRRSGRVWFVRGGWLCPGGVRGGGVSGKPGADHRLRFLVHQANPMMFPTPPSNQPTPLSNHSMKDKPQNFECPTGLVDLEPGPRAPARTIKNL